MQVRVHAHLRPVVGGPTVEVPLPAGSTVRQLVEEIVRRHPPLGPMLLGPRGEISRAVHVFVNGRGAPRLENGLDTLLSPGDTIDLIPAAAGGSDRPG